MNESLKELLIELKKSIKFDDESNIKIRIHTNSLKIHFISFLLHNKIPFQREQKTTLKNNKQQKTTNTIKIKAKHINTNKINIQGTLF